MFEFSSVVELDPGFGGVLPNTRKPSAPRCAAPRHLGFRFQLSWLFGRAPPVGFPDQVCVSQASLRQLLFFFLESFFIFARRQKKGTRNYHPNNAAQLAKTTRHSHSDSHRPTNFETRKRDTDRVTKTRLERYDGFLKHLVGFAFRYIGSRLLLRGAVEGRRLDQMRGEGNDDGRNSGMRLPIVRYQMDWRDAREGLDVGDGIGSMTTPHRERLTEPRDPALC